MLIIGTCSICGGAVIEDTCFIGPVGPAPRCNTCGAKKRRSYGPIVDMEPCPPPSHSYPVPFDKLTPDQIPYYVKDAITKEIERRLPRNYYGTDTFLDEDTRTCQGNLGYYGIIRSNCGCGESVETATAKDDKAFQYRNTQDALRQLGITDLPPRKVIN